MIRRLFVLLLLVAPCRASSEPFTLTDDFVSYMKSVLNPFEFGQRDDGRFYPYSTRYGRRIGYGLPVIDKVEFAKGVTPAQAENRLRAELLTLVPRLEAHLAQTHPKQPFAGLSRFAQEMLLDHAFTEGIDRLPASFVAAILRGDWCAVIEDHLYVRAPDGWPDYVKNAAFGRRWIYSEANPTRAARGPGTPNVQR